VVERLRRWKVPASNAKPPAAVSLMAFVLLVGVGVATPKVAWANGSDGGDLERDCLRPLAYTTLLDSIYWADDNVPEYEGVGYYGGIQVFKNRTAKTGQTRVMCAGYYRWTSHAAARSSNSHDDNLNTRDEDHPFEDIWRGFHLRVHSFRVIAAKGCKTTARLWKLLIARPERRVADATKSKSSVITGWGWDAGNPAVYEVDVRTVCPNRTVDIPLPAAALW
jgi:hypothetical protein